jgi:cobalamin biosynthesis protein CobT
MAMAHNGVRNDGDDGDGDNGVGNNDGDDGNGDDGDSNGDDSNEYNSSEPLLSYHQDQPAGTASINNNSETLNPCTSTTSEFSLPPTLPDTMQFFHILYGLGKEDGRVL